MSVEHLLPSVMWFDFPHMTRVCFNETKTKAPKVMSVPPGHHYKPPSKDEDNMDNMEMDNMAPGENHL